MSAPHQVTDRLPGHGGRDNDNIQPNQFPVRTFSAPPGDVIDTNRPNYPPRAAGGYNPGSHGHFQPHARAQEFVPSGVFQPGQPFVPRGVPQHHHVARDQAHLGDPNVAVNPQQHGHVPGHGRGNHSQHNQQLGGRPGHRPPNPNVPAFVPQSMQHAQVPQAGYHPRHQQPPYYVQGGYGANPMYAPHISQGPLPYPPMQHAMGLNPAIGLTGHPGQIPTPPSVVPPPREKKTLLIVNPKTKQPINECLATDTKKAAPAPVPPKPTSTLRAGSAEFVMPSAVQTPVSPPIPPSSPVHKTPVLSPKPQPKISLPIKSPQHTPKNSPKPQQKELKFLHSPKTTPKSPAAAVSSPKQHPKSPVAGVKPPVRVLSPKAVEPSLVFGTVEPASDLLVASPKHVSLPPGFDAPKDVADENAADAADAEEEEPKPVAAQKRTVVRPPNDAPSKKGKTCYSFLFLVSFREEYPDLPEFATEATGWLTMDITSDGPSGRSGNRRTDRQNSGGPPLGQLQRQSSRGNNDKSKQWQRDQTTSRRTNGGGGRGGKMRQQPSLNDDGGALKRREDRWVPVKATSNLDKVLKQVQSIMNKMTTQKFDVLSTQLTEIDMESMEMLDAVIKIIFDKAVGEPHFCEMYANLCVRLEQHWKVWSFLQIVRHEDTWSWTTMSDVDAEVVGPFATEDELFENAEEDPTDVISAPEGMTLKDVHVRKGKFIKVWESNGELFWSGQNVEDLGESQVLNGPFATKEEANTNAIKTTSFKRILLNACQNEFEKDNIYEELEQAKDKAREDGTLTAELEASFEEKKMLTKQRMLGNIRFIGELFRKGMLQERIMHACIMKLLSVARVPNRDDYKIAPLNAKAAPDEESIESLSKLLTTMGKDLEAQRTYPGAMTEYFDYLAYLTKDKRLSSRINFMILDVIDLRNNRWVPRRKELKQKTLEETRKDYEKELASAGKKNGGPPPPRGVPTSSSAREMGQRGSGARGGQPPQRSNFSLEKSRSQQIDKPSAIGRPSSFPGGGKGKAPAAGRPASVEKPAPVSPQKEIENQLAPLSDDVKDLIAKKSKSILEEFVDLKDAKEAASCVVELKASQAPAVSAVLVSSILVKEGLKVAVEAKDATRIGIFDALVTLFEEKQLEPEAVKYGLESVILFAPEVSFDVPKIHEHVGSIIGRLFKVIPSLTLEWLISGIDGNADALQELVDSRVLAGIVGVFLSQIPPSIAQDQGKVFAKINLTSILPSYARNVSDVLDWANKFHLSQVLPAVYAAGQVYAVAKDSKDVSDAIKWVESNVPGEMRVNRVFTKQTCLFLLSLPSWEPYSNLLMGLVGDLEGEVALVGGIVQDVPPEKLKALLSALIEEQIVSKKAVMTWKDTSRRSAGRDKAWAQIGDYIEKLRK